MLKMVKWKWILQPLAIFRLPSSLLLFIHNSVWNQQYMKRREWKNTHTQRSRYLCLHLVIWLLWIVHEIVTEPPSTSGIGYLAAEMAHKHLNSQIEIQNEITERKPFTMDTFLHTLFLPYFIFHKHQHRPDFMVAVFRPGVCNLFYMQNIIISVFFLCFRLVRIQ